MFARVTTMKGSPNNVDDGIREFKNQPQRYGRQDGFIGKYLLVDRTSGEMISITLWETEGHLQATAATASQQRQRNVQAAAAAPPSVAIYEVAFHPPEMA